MVRIMKNIAVIAIAFDFCTGLGHDQVDLGRDIASPGRDMSSGYVLKVFFNFGIIWFWSELAWSHSGS